MNTSYTISCLREGNQAAFKTVFFEYHERIYAYVLRKTHSSYLAEETLQLTFVKLWKYRDRLTDDHSLFTQITPIARKACRAVNGRGQTIFDPGIYNCRRRGPRSQPLVPGIGKYSTAGRNA